MRTAAYRAARRAGIVPFESAIAVLLVVSGAAALAGAGLVDPVADLLPGWEAVSLSALSIAAGVLMLAGVAGDAWRFEVPGLGLLAGVIMARFLLFGYFFGYGESFLVTGVFDGAIVAAAVSRFRTVTRGEVVIRLPDDGLDDGEQP